MFSAVHPTADIAKILRQVRFVPHPDIRDVAATSELLLLRGVGEAQSRGR